MQNDTQAMMTLINNLEARLKESIEQQKISREEFIILRAAVDALHRRLDKAEKELEGNVTTEVLYKWLIAAATIITSLGVIFAALFKLFGGAQ